MQVKTMHNILKTLFRKRRCKQKYNLSFMLVYFSFIFLFIYLYIYLSIYLPIYVSFHPSTYLCFYLPIYSIYLSILYIQVFIYLANLFLIRDAKVKFIIFLKNIILKFFQLSIYLLNFIYVYVLSCFSMSMHLIIYF